MVHALQDREHDLIARGLEIIGDLDSGYAFVAVMEGTAMVAGMAYMQGVPLDQLGDLGPMLRAGYEENNAGMEVFSRAPVYLQERLIGPYVDGATLVHAYLRRRPESTMATLFEELPAGWLNRRSTSKSTRRMTFPPSSIFPESRSCGLRFGDRCTPTASASSRSGLSAKINRR